MTYKRKYPQRITIESAYTADGMSAAEREIALQLAALARDYGLENYLVREMPLDIGASDGAERRRFRLDFAFPPPFSVGIEVQGLVGRDPKGLGGHRTIAGAQRDWEKHNHAVSQGWSIIQVPSKKWEKAHQYFVRLMNAIVDRNTRTYQALHYVAPGPQKPFSVRHIADVLLNDIGIGNNITFVIPIWLGDYENEVRQIAHWFRTHYGRNAYALDPIEQEPQDGQYAYVTWAPRPNIACRVDVLHLFHDLLDGGRRSLYVLHH